MTLETENRTIDEFTISPSVRYKGVSLIGMQADNFIVIYNGKEIITPIFDDLTEAFSQFEKDAGIHDIPLIQNILIDLETGFSLLQQEHRKHIQLITKTKEPKDFPEIRDYIKDWDPNSSVNWDNSELPNEEQEVWLKRRMSEQMGKTYKIWKPIMIPYKWIEDIPQWEPDPT